MSSSPPTHSTGNSSLPPQPQATLTAKQVRELRRLCRKTANRAEYDDRSVQVRQIASIVAMGGPSLACFAPRWSERSELQVWVDNVRADGADWRDERILLPRAVEELRDWDRLLKVWAEERFGAGDGAAEGTAPAVEAKVQRTPLRTNSRMSLRRANTAKSGQRGAGSPFSLGSPHSRADVMTTPKTNGQGKIRRVSSSSAVGTPITPSGVARRTPPSAVQQRPKLVPAPVVPQHSPVLLYNEDSCDSGGDDGCSSVSEEGEGEHQMIATRNVPKAEGSETQSMKPIRRTVSARTPLGSLSFSRVGNFINVDLPARHVKDRTSKRTLASGFCSDENRDPENRSPDTDRDMKTLVDSIGAISVKDEEVAPEKPRDWSTLRRSRRGMAPITSKNNTNTNV